MQCVILEEIANLFCRGSRFMLRLLANRVFLYVGVLKLGPQHLGVDGLGVDGES